MEGDGRSSDDLSSAPASDTDTGPFTNQPHLHSPSNTIVVSSTHSPAGPSTVGNHPASGTNGDKPKIRRPRKKKDPNEPPTEKKPRKVRSDKGLTIAQRNELKRIKLEQAVNGVQGQLNPPSQTSLSLVPTVIPAAAALEAPRYAQNGVVKPDVEMQPSFPARSYGTPTPMSPQPPNQHQAPATQASPYRHPQQHQQQQQHPPPPPRAKAIFDPVRSLNIIDEPTPQPTAHRSSLTSPPPQTQYRPSASPAISSIINPPNTSSPPLPSSLLLAGSATTTSQPPNTAVMEKVPHMATPASSLPPPTKTEAVAAMDVDVRPMAAASDKKPTPDAPAKPAPKPRAKEQPPPLPAGSGLLSSTLFGGDSGMESRSGSEKGPNIVLHIDLNDPNNKVINFARIAEDKYGFAALYPRQAAQKERLARVAAAGAALERTALGNKGTSAGDSGDEDGSVDIDRDSENDGDVAMSGMNGTGEAVNSGTDGPAPRRRKRKDEYDADDPFVDDSEMLWEAQAAASKDGFFVYCGPLVPEGEKPAVERADGTVKRGRGRGRGSGSRGGRGGASTAHGEGGGTGRGSGGGPGSRGGGVTRKPRVSKADRAQRDAAKKQKEQMAVLAAKPTGGPLA